MIAHGRASYLTMMETLLCELVWTDSVGAELPQHFRGSISRTKDNALGPHTSVSNFF